MRWPLKSQIFVRLVLLLVITIGAITYAHIRSTIRESRERESQQLAQVVQLLTDTQFPLTPNVLQFMSTLSGAEFRVSDVSGTTLAESGKAPRLDVSRSDRQDSMSQPSVVDESEQSYLYQRINKLSAVGTPNAGNTTVHIYVPRKSDQELWWSASRSPLLVAAISLPAALMISLALASQVTRPLSRLRTQVQEIAQGNIREIEPVKRNDEVRDLNQSINEMAVQLHDHDHQVRRNERLQTLIQVSSGIAHNLRNSATGCKMAIELLATEHSNLEDSDTIEVARRQLNLMENYIRKFMHLAESGSSPESSGATEVDLSEILNKVTFLLQPSAAHLNVTLEIQTIGNDFRQVMNPDDAEQLMINLINNAIEAASQHAVAHHRDDASVDVTLDTSESTSVRLTVTDNGEGPSAEIAEKIFQPFVTGKPEGTGLGLSLVQEIADRVGGTVGWTRADGKTRFEFEVPKAT